MRNRKQTLVLSLGMTAFALVLFAVALLNVGCGAKQYHIATVSVVSANAVAGAVQDSADAFTCGAPTAPPEGQCLSTEQRKAVAAKLSPTFEKIGEVAVIVRDTDPLDPIPASVKSLLQDAKDLLNQALALLPVSAQKRVADLTGGQ